MRSVFFLLCLSFAACESPVGQRELRYPVLGRGEPATAFDVGGWQVSLTTAQVGFGPAYFCATEAASADLCPTAVSQLARAAAVDALNPAAQSLGEAEGETGEIRSATYDFAYSWFATQQKPTPAEAAPRGHSVYLEGTAARGDRTLRFVAEVDLVPRVQGTRTVQGARVEASLGPDPVALTVAFRPLEWLRGVDFDQLAQSSADPVQLLPASRAYEAIVLALVAGAPPSFHWSPMP